MAEGSTSSYLVNFMKFDESFTELIQPPVSHGHLCLKPHTLHLIHCLQRMKTLLKCVWMCAREREREREMLIFNSMAKKQQKCIHTLVKRPAVSIALSIWSTLKRYLTHLQLTYLSAVSSVLASSIHLAASFRSPACYRNITTDITLSLK